MSRSEFAQDLRTQLAVQASFAQLGEASMRVDESLREAHPEIEWGAIRHFRNFMIHVYDQIDPDKVFETIQQDLRPLREKLWRMLLPESDSASLYGRIDWILAAKWDPIGVEPLKTPAARDEYTDYVSNIVTTGERGGVQGVFELLRYIRTKWMGLPPADQADRSIAQAIMHQIDEGS